MSLSRIREFFRWFYRYRSLRLAPEGVRFLLLTLAMGIAALNTGNNLLYLLLAMMLSLIVMSGILSEQCLRHLTIRRRIPEHLFANASALMAVAITNRKPRLPSFSLRALDIVEGKAVDRGIRILHLPAGGSETRSYPVCFTRRGRHLIDGLKLQTRFPFGLFVKGANLPLASELVVYPEIRQLPEGLAHDLTVLGHEQALSMRGHGSGLYNLREYQAGDDSRAIHWKTSARQSRLIVKETEIEDLRQVTLVLPVSIPADGAQAFERAVSWTASLADYFRRHAFAVRLAVRHQEVPYGIGDAHFYDVLRVLALCEPVVAERGGERAGEAFHGLADRTARGEITIVVMSWPDPDVYSACRGITRFFHAWEQP